MIYYIKFTDITFSTKEYTMIKAFFLDRDGVINRDDEPYLRFPEQVEIFQELPEAMRLIAQAGYEVFVISNQSGISEGKISYAELQSVEKQIEKLLLQSNAPIPHKWFYCPHLPEEHCQCRKPAAGLILQAQKEFDIDLKQSFFIGDRFTDMQAAFAAGCQKGVLVMTGYGRNDRDKPLFPEYMQAENVLEAVKLILK